MSQFMVLLGIPAVLLCLAVIVYCLRVGGRTGSAEGDSYLWTLFVAFCVFLAVWLWLTPAIGMLAWAMWFGDNMPLWFRNFTPWLAAGVGLLVATAVVYRGRRRHVNGRYLRIYFAIATILLALLVAVGAYEWGSKIYGATPQAASEKYLEGMQGLPDQYRLVEERRWNTDGSEKPRWVSYRIVDPQGVAYGRVRVARYSRYWWTFASYTGFFPADEALARGKKLLSRPGREDVGLRILRELVENHPDTAEAQEAARVLEETAVTATGS